MTIGQRLREERGRLGHSQTDFAALAGAKKGTQISWEKDASSPTAQALVNFANAGADVLYILTGKRTPEPPDKGIPQQLASGLEIMRQDILNPAYSTADTVRLFRDEIAHILKDYADDMPPQLRSEYESLADIVSSPANVANFRAADFAQLRERRDDARQQLEKMLSGPYRAGSSVLHALASLALDHAVPITRLVLLVEDIHADITSTTRKRGAKADG